MIYPYVCRNEKCEAFEEVVDISKPMMESDREEKCEKCEALMERVYEAPSIRTLDGYKS